MERILQILHRTVENAYNGADMIETLRGKLWFGGILIAATIVAFIGIGLYDDGYRFTGVRILFPATVSVFVPEGATIAYDLKHITPAASSTATNIHTVSGTHTIGISKEGYWPWEKQVELQSGSAQTFRPFILPKTTEGDVIEKTDPLYARIEAAFATTTLPTKDAPILSQDGSVALYIEGSEIKARFVGEGERPVYFCTKNPCENAISVLVFDAELRSLAFLPGRNDVALFAAQNGLFALELDTRGIQNFQPVYKGIRPSFITMDGSVYMKDATSLFRVKVK